MITLYIKNHTYSYEMECLTRLFFPNERIETVKIKENVILKKPYIYTEKIIASYCNFILDICLLGQSKRKEFKFNFCEENKEKECERKMSIELYNILSNITSLNPPWGILTGVRPVKLMRKLISDIGKEKTVEYFRNEFLVNEEKLNLAIKTLDIEQNILNKSKPKSFSIYISIPFCPSRCSYCSFVSQSVEKAAKLIPDYLKLLCIEIEQTAEIANRFSLELESVYIGGGTPTILTSKQLEALVDTVNKCFNMDDCKEFTIEAGRPDTITEEKLKVMREYGVSRISINPQTLNDDVLNFIGRRHTSEHTIKSFDMARDLGFSNINMDLIAGLPSDTYLGFCNTLRKILSLSPESITIHTLSMKKASHLTEEGLELNFKDAKQTYDMLKFSSKELNLGGYIPYYLYRQTRMVGNLENVGWSKPGYEGLYNIYVMDETHTILSCGAGAVSKLINPHTNNLERIFNFKFPYEYIYNFKEIIRRKEQVSEFYGKLHELI